MRHDTCSSASSVGRPPIQILERDKGGMEILKSREKEKGISERGKTNAKMGRVFHEISGRDKEKRKGRNEMKKQTVPEGT
jgi:hypothetical protein